MKDQKHGPLRVDSLKLAHGCRMIYAGCPSLVWSWRTVMSQLSSSYCISMDPESGILMYPLKGCFWKSGVLLVGVPVIRALLFGVYIRAPDF